MELFWNYLGTIMELARWLGGAGESGGNLGVSGKGREVESCETKRRFPYGAAGLSGCRAYDWKSVREPVDCCAEALVR